MTWYLGTWAGVWTVQSVQGPHYGLDDREVWVRCPAEVSNFSLLQTVQIVSGGQLSTQWVKQAISPRVKRPSRKADYSHPSRSKVKSKWRYTSTPPSDSIASTGITLPLQCMAFIVGLCAGSKYWKFSNECAQQMHNYCNVSTGLTELLQLHASHAVKLLVSQTRRTSICSRLMLNASSSQAAASTPSFVSTSSVIFVKRDPNPLTQTDTALLHSCSVRVSVVR